MGAGDFAAVEAVADYLRRVSHMTIRKGNKKGRGRNEVNEEKRVIKEKEAYAVNWCARE